MSPLYLFIGFLLLLAGLYLLISHYYALKYGYHTSGKVIRNVGKWGGSGGSTSYMYFPLIQFFDHDNNVLELVLDVGCSFPIFCRGQTVKIVYYEGKIHAAGIGWQILYWTVFGAGLGVVVYQITLIVSSNFWSSLSGWWKILRLIL